MQSSDTHLVARRLRHQHLDRPASSPAAALVAWLGAVQAQDFGGATWGVGQRLAGTSAADLHRAFDDGEILRTHVMRPTWHFVAPPDIRWMLELTAPRVQQFNAGYYRKQGLEARQFSRGRAVLERRLRDRTYLTREEIGRRLADAGIRTSRLGVIFIIMHAELERVVCSGPRRGKQFTWALLDERAPGGPSLPRDEGLAELTRRYFTSHGPATVRDFAWWSGLTMSDASAGIALNGSALASEPFDGRTYWSALTPRVRMMRTPLVRLLPNYDEFLIAYKDRQHVPESTSTRPVTFLRDRYPHHLTINGRLVGSWRPQPANGSVAIEIDPYRPLTSVESKAVARAVASYGRFHGTTALVRDTTPPASRGRSRRRVG